jgi:patatin-like phospholipase/acyl hydrolase
MYSSFYFVNVTKYSIDGIVYNGNPNVADIEFIRDENYYEDIHEMKHIKIIETVCSCDGEIHGSDASYPYSDDKYKHYYDTECKIITKYN